MAGPAGPPAAAPQYAYIYNQLGQTVASHGNVVFSNNGDISSGFVHVPGTAQITVVGAGEYEISFSIAGEEPSQFGITDNGHLVAGTLFGSASGDAQNSGTAILSAAAGDVLTLQNYSPTSSVDLAPFAGGSLLNSDATFAIYQVG